MSNSDKIVMWRFLRNHRLILRLQFFRVLIYWAHRAVVPAIAWHLVDVVWCTILHHLSSVINWQLLWIFCHYQDVGEGWWEAKNERGQRGLVPESYLEVYTHSSWINYVCHAFVLCCLYSQSYCCWHHNVIYLSFCPYVMLCIVELRVSVEG